MNPQTWRYKAVNNDEFSVWYGFPFQDGPQNGTYTLQSPIEVKGNFIDYIRFIRFNPNTSGSIYVTLGTVTWNIDGKIAYQGSPLGWQFVTESTPDPVGPDDSDQFPFYTQPR